MIKAIIFDFYDVIRTDTFKHWMNKHDYILEGDFLRANRLLDRGDISVNEFIIELGDIVGRSADDILAEMETDTRIDYAVLEIAEKLRKSYKIGLLSNASSSAIRNSLRENDLEKYFDEIVVSSEVGMVKPAPEMFHHMLEKLEVKPKEAVFIDDNPDNIAGAEAVGVTGIVFTTARDLTLRLHELALTI